jgi:hypothetical protein
MRPSLFLAMGSAIVLLLIIHPATGGGCGGAVQGQGLGCGRDRVPSQPTVPARALRPRIAVAGSRPLSRQLALLPPLCAPRPLLSSS